MRRRRYRPPVLAEPRRSFQLVVADSKCTRSRMPVADRPVDHDAEHQVRKTTAPRTGRCRAADRARLLRDLFGDGAAAHVHEPRESSPGVACRPFGDAARHRPQAHQQLSSRGSHRCFPVRRHPDPDKGLSGQGPQSPVSPTFFSGPGRQPFVTRKSTSRGERRFGLTVTRPHGAGLIGSPTAQSKGKAVTTLPSSARRCCLPGSMKSSRPGSPPKPTRHGDTMLVDAFRMPECGYVAFPKQGASGEPPCRVPGVRRGALRYPATWDRPARRRLHGDPPEGPG